jgi:hypothetical protein
MPLGLTLGRPFTPLSVATSARSSGDRLPQRGVLRQQPLSQSLKLAARQA